MNAVGGKEDIDEDTRLEGGPPVAAYVVGTDVVSDIENRSCFVGSSIDSESVVLVFSVFVDELLSRTFFKVVFD
jgi:hypothetical protein